MEGTDAYVLTPLLFEHYVLTNHINDVSPLLDGLNRAGVETRQAQGRGYLRWALKRSLILTREGKPCSAWLPVP